MAKFTNLMCANPGCTRMFPVLLSNYREAIKAGRPLHCSRACAAAHNAHIRRMKRGDDGLSYKACVVCGRPFSTKRSGRERQTCRPRCARTLRERNTPPEARERQRQATLRTWQAVLRNRPLRPRWRELDRVLAVTGVEYEFESPTFLTQYPTDRGPTVDLAFPALKLAVYFGPAVAVDASGWGAAFRDRWLAEHGWRVLQVDIPAGKGPIPEEVVDRFIHEVLD